MRFESGKNNKYIPANIESWLIGLYVLANCFTGVSSLLHIEALRTNIHIHIIVAIFLIVYVMVKRKICFPREGIILIMLFAEMLLVVIGNLYRYLPSGMFLTYCYDLVMVFVIFTILKEKDIQSRKIMQSVAIVMAIVITIKNLLEFDAFLHFFKGLYGHPVITSFFGGGINLEATWMTLFGCFFEKKKRYYYLGFTTVLSILYVSRTAIILNVLLLFIYMLQEGYKKAIRIAAFFVLLGSLVIIGGVLTDNPLIMYVINRFANIGKEVGSRERLIMWEKLPLIITENPFGVGSGNAIKYMNDVFDMGRAESNIHNIYLQYIIDNGIVGFIMYLVSWGMLVVEQLKSRFNNPYAVFLIAYAVGGLVQFTGKDVFLFIILACYFVERKRYRLN